VTALGNLRRDGPHLDVLAGIVFGAAGIVDVCVIHDRQGPLWLNIAGMVALGLLVAWRRRSPRAAGYGFAALVAGMSLVATPAPALVTVLFGLLLFPYAVGAQVRGWWSYAYVPVIFAVVCIVDGQWHDVQVGDYVFPTALALGAYAAGRNMVHRTALAVELHEAALRSGEERDAEARRAVAAERRRIAHEMHDVVAHSISVMVVQAGGARRILERDAARAQDAAAQIERTGRETLLEMRRLLGVMRRPDAAPELEPNPTLDGVADLAARARAAGLAVDLHVDGARRGLRPGLELAAYRVVEQGLEDALRGRERAGTQSAAVTVRWAPTALEITIADERPDMPFAVGASPALIGVRERVAVYGGELRAGQRSDGGHEVHVRFPLDDAPGTQPPDSDPVPAQGAA
jgi:signal transduction histidine kinase